MELWCNESQERYVLLLQADAVATFERICGRERCPYALIGVLTAERELRVLDSEFDNEPVAMPLEVLFGKPPKATREASCVRREPEPWDGGGIELGEAVERVLSFPAVADKSFLITIADRTVGGLVARDQMIGPWQVPVGDAAVTASSYWGYTGEAMAMARAHSGGDSRRPGFGSSCGRRSGHQHRRGDVPRLADVRLSANWMAAVGHRGDDYTLFEMVRPDRGRGVVSRRWASQVPVGKDSLSMRTEWQAEDEVRAVTAPVSLIVSAFAPSPTCAER